MDVYLTGTNSVRTAVVEIVQAPVCAFTDFSITLALSQCPLLIIIEVGISPNPWPWSKGVSQEAIFAIKGVTVSMLC